ASDEECRSFQPRLFRFRQVTCPPHTVVLHEVASPLPHAVLRSVRVALLWAALCLSPIHAAPPAPRDTGLEPVLLLTPGVVAQVDRAALTLHPPRKTGERLLESSLPWENATLNWFSILREGDRFRLWYECYDVAGWPTPDDTSFCYAESTDGLNWTRPQLGLTEYQGSTANNILFRQIGTGAHRSRVHGTCVFLDPAAPAEERYKAVSQGQFQGRGDRPYYIAGMTSPDGLKWRRLPDPIGDDFADSQYSGFRDPASGQYWLYGRTAGRGGRAVGRADNARFTRFESLTRDVCLQAHPDQPSGQDHYNPACQLCPTVPGLVLAFPSLFQHRADTLDIRLAVAEPTGEFRWPDREEAFIPLGAAGEWDGGSLYFGNGGCVPLGTGDDWAFYYSASRLKHAETELDNLRDPRNRRVITRAIAPAGRLAGYRAGEDVADLRTVPLRSTGRRLQLNARVAPGGEIRVALLRPDGSPVPGRGINDCAPVTGDSRTAAVSWNSGADVVAQAGLIVHFTLRHAELFGVQFLAQ
ncbi:MAG: hypothetical protein ACKOJF_16060, partial [Planctomycetaceae bacterium]